MRTCLGLLAIGSAACGPRAAAPSVEPEPVPAAAFVPGGPYAALFEPGRTWRYQVHTSSELYADSDDGSGFTFEPLTIDDNSVVTCTIAAHGPHDGGVYSHVTCDAELAVDGWWWASHAGVARLIGPPPAQAWPLTIDSETGCTVRVPHEGENQRELCFEASRGVVRGWATEPSKVWTFELLPAD